MRINTQVILLLELNNVEFYIYDANRQIQYSDYDFSEYAIYSNNTPGASPTR